VARVRVILNMQSDVVTIHQRLSIKVCSVFILDLSCVYVGVPPAFLIKNSEVHNTYNLSIYLLSLGAHVGASIRNVNELMI
jgi:hypothetical protein